MIVPAITLRILPPTAPVNHRFAAAARDSQFCELVTFGVAYALVDVPGVTTFLVLATAQPGPSSSRTGRDTEHRRLPDNQSHNVAAVRIEPFRLPGRVTGGRIRKWTPTCGGTPHSPQARPSHPFIVRTRP